MLVFVGQGAQHVASSKVSGQLRSSRCNGFVDGLGGFGLRAMGRSDPCAVIGNHSPQQGYFVFLCGSKGTIGQGAMQVTGVLR